MSPRPELPPQYVPSSVEERLYEGWVADGLFTPTGEGEPFCVVIPPPNVTGQLHMGHALNHTVIDVITRRARMQGRDVLWLPGMDHAGIATQNVVERELARDGQTRHDLGREAFLDRVWQWKAEYGGRILGQMRRLGDAVDWTRERFTMDEGSNRAVLTIFKRLHDDGLIYRAERIINWCPRCLTALSDIEVDHKDDDGELVSISYGPLVVATTRVETMLGDTAVAVHPGDERYAHLVGTEIELPLTGRRIPVVADEHVDPEFGTGAVKVTPAHDPNDFAIAQRHGLPPLTVMDERGVITAAGPFEGLDRSAARTAVTAALRELGLVVEEKRPYTHAVGHCSRCDTVVEPRLSLQWFVKVGPLAEAAGDAVRDGRTSIEPPELAQRYFDWVDDMHDWCISRQLWWGHRIPVWYGPGGETVVCGPDDEPPAGAGWVQDEDVLDTWFSSALWPFSTLGWPDETDDLARYYPTTVLVTGYDIIFFWVARMMMFGLYAFDGKQPFDVVALTGLVRDARGRKMSKSAGNGIDPLDWIEAYGADATRFTLARGANPGADVPVSEDWVKGSRNFVTKVWNATRFALLSGADASAGVPAELALPDRWVLSRLAEVTADVDRHLDAYDLAKACDALYHFAWDEVFDWYVELSKTRVARGGAEADAVRAVLGHVLDALLRLLHPVLPFVTEELWRTLTGGRTLVRGPWPVADADRRDPVAERDLAQLQEVVTEVRRFRAEQGVKPSLQLPAVVVAEADSAVASHLEEVGALARLQPLTAADAVPDGWSVVTVAGVRVGLDLSGTVDVPAERARLTRLVEGARKEQVQVEAKLGNPSFVAKAPADVVTTMRARQAAAHEEQDRLQALLDALPAS